MRTRAPQASSPSGSARVVLARTSEPPCFSVMPMPSVTAVFCASGAKRASYCVLAMRVRQRFVQRRVGAQRRRHRVAHRHRAQHRRLGLRPQDEAGRALDVRAGAARPRRAVQAVAQRAAEQRVVAGMELHLVDAVAEAVVRVQLGRVHVRQARVRHRLGRARLGAELPTAPSASNAGRLNFSASRSARSVSNRLTSTNGVLWLITSCVAGSWRTPSHVHVGDAVVEVLVRHGLEAVAPVEALQVRLRTDASRLAGHSADAARDALARTSSWPMPCPRRLASTTTRPIDGSSNFTPGSSTRK